MKKIISLIIALFIPFCVSVFADGNDDTSSAADETQTVFNDIEFHWAKNEIQALADEKVVSGDGNGNFLPDKKISRAEFASMICKFVGTDKISYTDLADVGTNDWYYEYVQTMIARGYMNCIGKQFDPEGEMTMRDAMTVFYRLCSEKKNDITVNDFNAVVNALKINEPMTDWEKNAFAYVSKNELLYKFYGVNDYELSRGLTRAEAAVLVNRLQNHIGLAVEVDTEEDKQ